MQSKISQWIVTELLSPKDETSLDIKVGKISESCIKILIKHFLGM